MLMYSNIGRRFNCSVGLCRCCFAKLFPYCCIMVELPLPLAPYNIKCGKYEAHTISFQTFFVQAFKIVVDS